MYRYTYIQNRHNIKKNRAAKLKKWCMYVCGKKGGRGCRTAYRVGNL